MGDVTSLSLDLIHRRADARPLDDAAVADLADSIRDIGLITPVTVRQTGADRFELIAGNHRFAACDGLGWRDIECRVVDDDDLTAELRMIDENLMRAELSPSERARQTARRKAIYEELHPETRHGAIGNGREKVRQVGDSTFADRFTSETAGTSGRSERAVQRDVERGTKVCADALDIVRGTKLDTGSYLDKLKRLPPSEQVQAAKRDLTVSHKADRAEASAKGRAPTPPAPEPAKADPFATWLDLTDRAARLDAEAIFDACPVRQRPTLSQHCEAVRAILDEIADLIDRPNIRRPAR